MADNASDGKDGVAAPAEESTGDSSPSDDPKQVPRVSEEGAMRLLTTMIERGYFHEGVAVVDRGGSTKFDSASSSVAADDDSRDGGDRDGDDDDASMEAWREWKKYMSERRIHSADDPACGVVLTTHPSPSDRTCYTRSGLVSELESTLRSSPFDGRGTLSELAAALMVDEKHVERAAGALCASSSSSPASSEGCRGVERIGLELLTAEHLDVLAGEVNSLLESSPDDEYGGGSAGRCAVSALATDHFRLPLDATVLLLSDRMTGGGGPRIVRQDARMIVGAASVARYIVTRDYEERILEKISNELREVDEPTPVLEVAKEYDAEESFVVRRVGNMCEDGSLEGGIRGGKGGGDATASTAGVLFVPHCYEVAQQRGVEEFFSANGYITREKCAMLGVSAGRMGDLVRKCCPDAVSLTDAIIDPETIISPVEALVQEAAAQNAFVDLRMHVPEDLVTNEEDLQMILARALSNLDESGDEQTDEVRASRGVNVLSDGEALYCSPGMVDDIRTTILMPLIEAYGKSRAEVIDQLACPTKKKKGSGVSVDGGEIITTGATKKRAGKRGAKKGGKHHQQSGPGDNGDDNAASAGTTTGRKISARDKRRAKKAKAVAAAKAGSDASSSSLAAGIVPLYLVARGVAEAYPDLADIQESHGTLADADGDDAPKWRADAENDTSPPTSDGGGGGRGGGPLYEFCRVALDTPDFRSSCARAVRAESDKIAAARGGMVSASGRTEGAARVRAVEEAFEDDPCFPDACRLVRMLSRLPEEMRSAEEAAAAAAGGGDGEHGAAAFEDPNLAERLERDFLTGCGADFARRVTEYCLFKNGVEEGIFTFDPPKGEDEIALEYRGMREAASDLPSFCRPVDMSVRTFRRSYLSCSPSEGGEGKDPLPMLREMLPGNVGVDLARMWIFCGGDCYQGGRKVTEGGEQYTRPGSFRDFLRHVEESCLSLIKIPFKAMDKKAEKQAMFSRRQLLSRLLEDAESSIDVLELTVALLFQQARNIAVAGQELSHLVLGLLVRENKIPTFVGLKLNELAATAELSSGDVPDELVQCVKAFGLSRDVSKITS